MSKVEHELRRIGSPTAAWDVMGSKVSARENLHYGKSYIVSSQNESSLGAFSAPSARSLYLELELQIVRSPPASTRAQVLTGSEAEADYDIQMSCHKNMYLMCRVSKIIGTLIKSSRVVGAFSFSRNS